MANPSTRWDFVPVWGVYLNPVTNAPSPGTVTFTIPDRITRVDGRVIYAEGATVAATVGKADEQDAAVRVAVRNAWRAVDSVSPGFDGDEWDEWWDTVILPAAIFTKFPAADDPDIVQTGWTVQVSEALTSSRGKSYAIQPLLAHLDLPIPGVNLGTIEVPPGTSVPAPVYAKGIAGGVASLDEAGKIPADQIPSGIGGGVSSWNDLDDKPAVIAAGATAADARQAIAAASAAQGGLADTAVQPDDLTAGLSGKANASHTHDIATLTGTLDTAQLPAGAVVTLIWSGTDWRDTAGTPVTARPAGNICLHLIRGTAANRLPWMDSPGDFHDQEL